MQMTSQRLQQVLLQSLQLPQLSYAELPLFRQQLSTGLNNYSTLVNAVFLGAQMASPGMAFLAGYQNTIRCLDSDCPNDQLAAFCVSEKGVKKPWDMTTKIMQSEHGCLLTGEKGYVMLLPDELDRLYVIAKDENQQLKCVFLDAQIDGLRTTESLKAPFVEDIPHSGVSFENVSIPASQLLLLDGHSEANKPFRYWEDVHVALAMMAWMLRECIENGKSLSELDILTEQMCQLIEKFEEHPDYYSEEIFTVLDESHEVLDNYSKNLSQMSLDRWIKDRLLLQMGQKIRHLIKVKLSR